MVWAPQLPQQGLQFLGSLRWQFFRKRLFTHNLLDWRFLNSNLLDGNFLRSDLLSWGLSNFRLSGLLDSSDKNSFNSLVRQP